MDAGIGTLVEVIADGLRFLLKESGAIDALADAIKPLGRKDAEMLLTYHKVVTAHVQGILGQAQANPPPEESLEQFRILLRHPILPNAYRFTEAETAFRICFYDKLPKNILAEAREGLMAAFLCLETQAMATSFHLADLALGNSTLKPPLYMRMHAGKAVLCMKCKEHENVRPHKITDTTWWCPLCFDDNASGERNDDEEHRNVNRERVEVSSQQRHPFRTSDLQYPQSSAARPQEHFSRPSAPPSHVLATGALSCQDPEKHNRFWVNENGVTICYQCNTSSKPAWGSSPQKSSRIRQPNPDHSANHPPQTNWKPSFPPTVSRHPPSQPPTSHSHYPSTHNSPFSSHHRPTAAANAHVSSANTYNSPERPVAASSGGFAQRNPAYPPPQQISRTLSYALTTPGGSHPPSAAPDVQSNFPTTSSASRYQAPPAQAISSSSGRGPWHHPDDMKLLKSICPHNAGYGCQVCEFGVHSSSEKCDNPAEHARS
ncbi:hypothetical protein CPC08DRAFT_819578 [Agrocybe pediades]|nr:hypothetical protein CPC08DRAFT_819578 [Agrocybe pediades]